MGDTIQSIADNPGEIHKGMRKAEWGGRRPLKCVSLTSRLPPWACGVQSHREALGNSGSKQSEFSQANSWQSLVEDYFRV